MENKAAQGSDKKLVFGMEATVDVKPQKLNKIKPCSIACLSLPAYISDNTRTVMSTLFGIFEDKKSVEEGLIGDMLFGFSKAGIPAAATLASLSEMEQNGYVKFQAPDNTFVPISSDKIGASWIRYQRKLKDMVYEE